MFSNTLIHDHEQRFFSLKNEWEEETVYLSSINDICMHPAYQQIIGMGRIALPLILHEIQKNPGHWFQALKAISGENPVPPIHRGKIGKMAEAWIKWGKVKGYI
ncbi:MAG: hypothetical protein HQK89_16520 [Nitrospirae bacterium]|nr:hypothetical protein [Nitrospirota bacterium]